MRARVAPVGLFVLALVVSGVTDGAAADADAVVRLEDDPLSLRGTALGDPDPARRAEAMARLARTPARQIARDTAAEVLHHERAGAVLDSAIEALRLQPSLPVDPLMRFAGGEEHPELRARAIQMLADHGHEHPRVRAFLRTAVGDRSEEVREAVRKLLEDFGFDEFRPGPERRRL